MERSAATVRITEAIPTPIRVIGWLLLIGPVLAFFVEGPGRGGQLAYLVGEGLAVLRLGAGVAPFEFLAFAWVAVALVFWGQAHSRGQTLGLKSGMVLFTALAAQALLLVLNSAA